MNSTSHMPRMQYVSSHPFDRYSLHEIGCNLPLLRPMEADRGLESNG